MKFITNQSSFSSPFFVFQNSAPEMNYPSQEQGLKTPQEQLEEKIKDLENMQNASKSQEDRQDLLEEIEDLIAQVDDTSSERALQRLQELGVTISNLDTKVLEKRTPLAEVVPSVDKTFDDYFGQNTSKYLIPGEDFTFTDNEGNTHTTNLQDQSLRDASLFREDNMGNNNFKQALENAVLDGLIARAPEDPDRLFGLLTEGCASSEDVQDLQSMLSSMDSELADTIKKEDGKYGINTSKGVRRLSAFLKREHETRVDVELAALDIPYLPESPEEPIKPEFMNYSQVIIIADETGSMGEPHIQEMKAKIALTKELQDKIAAVDPDIIKTKFPEGKKDNPDGFIPIISKGEFRPKQGSGMVGEARELSFATIEQQLNALPTNPNSNPVLIEVYTDEGFQGTNEDMLGDISKLAKAKNVDIRFNKISKNSDGTMTNQVLSLEEIKDYYISHKTYARKLYVDNKMKRHNESYNAAMDKFEAEYPYGDRKRSENLGKWYNELDAYERRLNKEQEEGVLVPIRERGRIVDQEKHYSFDVPAGIGETKDLAVSQENTQKQIATYQQELAAYKEAYGQYKEDMAIYKVQKEEFDARYARLNDAQKKRVDKLLANK
jgi:hypothetical protein